MGHLIELTDIDIANLIEIQKLHDEAFQHFLDNGDGGHKSSEGYVEVNFGNFFDRASDRGKPVAGVGIYSYIFGPNRMHYFTTIADGLRTMKEWHKAEMEHDYVAEREMWEGSISIFEGDLGQVLEQAKDAEF